MTKTRSSLSNLISGALGGLVVLILGAVLIATDVIETGENEPQVAQPAPIARPAADSKGKGRTVSEIYAKEGRGVVFVQARGGSDAPSVFGEPREGNTATGSGFVIDRDGTILTNAHVVEGSEDVQVRFDEDGEFVDADVKGRDPSTDLAVLKVDPDDAELVPLPLGDSRQVRVGDPVVAIGNPFGFTRTVTTGIVSAKQRQIEAPNGFPIRNVIQTDASINPGNSGGPLLDGNGRVIGINSQIATGGSSGSVGIGFAVPVDTAKSLLPRLKEGGAIERAYLGVEMTAVTEQLAEDLKLPVKEGALIGSVVRGGPADDAGLRGGRLETTEGVTAGGDVIVAIDGKKVKTPDQVASAIAEKKPGDRVQVTYYRGDDRRTAKVTLAKRPASVTGGGAGGEQTPPEDDGGGLFPEVP